MSSAAPGQQQELSTGVVAVYVTVPNKDVARQIAFALVGEKLAACTNIIPGLESVYEWDGKIQCDNELLLMIKTSACLIPSLTNRVKELHPYDECEVIAVPVIGGSSSYLQWVINSATAKERQE
jgi:periplasmic divalent cation tolerance protein